MRSILNLYLDDSGTRNPDHQPNKEQFHDWFSLGGILLREEDEQQVRDAHAAFCEDWGITYPLHSYDIRNKSEKFDWLKGLDEIEYQRFIEQLANMLCSLPVLGHACVIDRPGYDARYREKYGRQTWMLCKTAYTVLIERCCKIAIRQGRRLRVLPEKGDPTADSHLGDYYRDLLSNGMPFSQSNSEKYEPLSAEDFRGVLYGQRFKSKSSPPIQIADLYLYPIARGQYQPEYRPYRLLNRHNRLIDCEVGDKDRQSIGIKCSCFELVNAH